MNTGKGWSTKLISNCDNSKHGGIGSIKGKFVLVLILFVVLVHFMPESHLSDIITPIRCNLCDSAFPHTKFMMPEGKYWSSVKAGSAKDPVLILLKHGGEGHWERLNISLPYAEPKSSTENCTLVCIEEIENKLGFYVSENEPFTPGKPMQSVGDAYQIQWNARLVQQSNGRVLGENKFLGGSQVPSIGAGEIYGTPPKIDQLRYWLMIALGNKTLMRTVLEHNSSVDALTFSPNNKILATIELSNITRNCTGTCTVILWNVDTGEKYRTLVEPCEKDWWRLSAVGGISLAFSPDGNILTSGSDDRVRFWNVSTGELFRTMWGNWKVSAFSPDGKIIISAGEDVDLFNATTGKILGRFEDNASFTDSVAISKDRKTLAKSSSSGSLGKVVLWNTSTEEVLCTIKPNESDIKIAFSPDGKILATGGRGRDCKVMLWDVSIGKRLRTLTGHEADITSVAFSPDGKILASGSDDCSVILWDASTGEMLKSLIGPAASVNIVAFSPDGKNLAVGYKDGNIKLWDVKLGLMS